MGVQILEGDVRNVLHTLPECSVHCCVTSPPYFGLRDYGVDGQIGLEATPDAYVAEMVAVFREVRRVLRDDGTLWLNLGDSYSQQGKWGGSTSGKHASGVRGTTSVHDRRERDFGLPFKQRLMIPARVAIALQADGWWLRDEIIWHKPAPMPISTKDRTTPAHEMIYMFSKSARYYYDMEAIKEPSVSTHPSGNGFARPQQVARGGRGKSEQWTPTEMRQPRSVWTVSTKPFKGAHFATFPPDLVKPCILAGCPEGGTVLDPFFGAGTTGLVAQQLGRNAIGIELNPEYAAIARKRISGDTPLFAANDNAVVERAA